MGKEQNIMKMQIKNMKENLKMVLKMVMEKNIFKMVI